jgi:hypothetical protein
MDAEIVAGEALRLAETVQMPGSIATETVAGTPKRKTPSPAAPGSIATEIFAGTALTEISTVPASICTFVPVTAPATEI